MLAAGDTAQIVVCAARVGGQRRVLTRQVAPAAAAVQRHLHAARRALDNHARGAGAAGAVAAATAACGVALGVRGQRRRAAWGGAASGLVVVVLVAYRTVQLVVAADAAVGGSFAVGGRGRWARGRLVGCEGLWLEAVFVALRCSILPSGYRPVLLCDPSQPLALEITGFRQRWDVAYFLYAAIV